MKKETINAIKSVNRKPIPSKKVFKSKKDYNRKIAKKIIGDE